MITRQEYLNTCGTDEQRQAAHDAYYKQFVTGSVRYRLARFLEGGGNINVLGEIDRLAIMSTPPGVSELMLKAGDYPTLGGLVCIYKVAYEELQQTNVEETHE